MITRIIGQNHNHFMFFFKLFIWERERERAGAGGEGEAGSSQGTWCGTRSQTLGSGPEPKADAQPLSHPGVPVKRNLMIGKNKSDSKSYPLQVPAHVWRRKDYETCIWSSSAHHFSGFSLYQMGTLVLGCQGNLEAEWISPVEALTNNNNIK